MKVARVAKTFIVAPLVHLLPTVLLKPKSSTFERVGCMCVIYQRSHGHDSGAACHDINNRNKNYANQSMDMTDVDNKYAILQAEDSAHLFSSLRVIAHCAILSKMCA